MRLMNVVGQNRRLRALRVRRLAREHRARFLHHREQQRMAILTLRLALQLVPERVPCRIWAKRKLRNY
jgi:hypothetical protein